MHWTDCFYGTDGFAKALLGNTDEFLLEFIMSDDFDDIMPMIFESRDLQHVEQLYHRINTLVDTITKH